MIPGNGSAQQLLETLAGTVMQFQMKYVPALEKVSGGLDSGFPLAG